MATLSSNLVIELCDGLPEKNLHQMAQFALAFPDGQIVVSLIRQLSWSHFVVGYVTELPPRDVFVQKLNAAIERSRQRLENRSDDPDD